MLLLDSKILPHVNQNKPAPCTFLETNIAVSTALDHLCFLDTWLPFFFVSFFFLRSGNDAPGDIVCSQEISLEQVPL